MRLLIAILALLASPIAAAMPRHIAFAFDGAPSNPAVRLLEIRRGKDGLSGEITSEWYGAMPMEHIVIDGSRITFDVRNINTRGVPVRHWTAELTPAGAVLTGGIWEFEVRMTGHPASRAEIAARRFHPTTLPPLKTLAPDGLAQTPPMGWSSWNKFADKIDDTTIRAIADAMVASGLRDAGYTYVNIDDGWQGTRGPDGAIRPNVRFPDMKALADYVHARGLKLGLYSSPGLRTCAGYEGSYGHVAQDAKTYAAWGVDYLKYDLCSGEWMYADADSVQRSYQEMGEALRATGRPILYSLCEYGRFAVGNWGRDVGGHLWRTTGDITDSYDSMARIGFGRNGKPEEAGPGGWNDPDMLEIGNGGMSVEEYHTHMTLWAMSAAPLMMGHDVRKTDAATLALLTNRAVIAIDQDKAGRQGQPIWKDGPSEIWIKPLADGSTAIALFNRNAQPAKILLPASLIGKGMATLRDVWNGTETDPHRPFTLPPHGTILLQLPAAPR